VGTGLGLHITHAAVARHGGSIDVQPNPAGGTCFVVTLPLTLPSGPSDKGAASRGEPEEEPVAPPQP
jgi:K+-sensing histidine kinase KdpD